MLAQVASGSSSQSSRPAAHSSTSAQGGPPSPVVSAVPGGQLIDPPRGPAAPPVPARLPPLPEPPLPLALPLPDASLVDAPPSCVDAGEAPESTEQAAPGAMSTSNAGNDSSRW